MKQVTLTADRFDGYGITVDVAGSTQDYAMALLNIFNNTRESHQLLAIENYDYNNCITVYCTENSKQAAIEYLESFGEVKKCEKVQCFRINESWLPACNCDMYSKQIVAQCAEEVY